MSTQPIEATEADRKAAYRYVADVLEGIAPHIAPHDGILSPEVRAEVVRIAGTMRATGNVPPIAVAAPIQASEQPAIASPVVGALAITKVNGSH